MEAKITKLSSIFYYYMLLVYLITKCDGKIQQLPCVFFFGDSLTDNGNNNFLATIAKVNHTPYGIDFPAGPTGRFSNGKNIPDFLGSILLLDFFFLKSHYLRSTSTLYKEVFLFLFILSYLLTISVKALITNEI